MADKQIVGPIRVVRESSIFFRNHVVLIGKFLIVFVIIFNLLEIGLSRFALAEASEENVALVMLLLSLLMGAIYQCSFIVMLSRINAGTRMNDLAMLSSVVEAMKFVVLYLFVSILVNIFIFIGLIFLILPGVYIYARLALFDFAIIINSDGPSTAIDRSWRLTKTKPISIMAAVLPIMLVMLGFMLVANYFKADNIVAQIVVNIIFWGLGSFLILIRYRFYVLLSQEQQK